MSAKKKTQKTMTQKKQAAIAVSFAAAGPTSQLVVRRGGNARTREVFVNGQLRLEWNGKDSIPIPLSPGTYTLHCVVMGNEGQTFAFSVIQPIPPLPLGAGVLTALGGEVFDRQVTIP
ncbi:MAG: hypothetical protein ACJ76Y_28675 [Thermoanaerobaculia bacterium]